jgi:MoaA/NifB/PqqE/SkfB family radical SAM enzyme
LSTFEPKNQTYTDEPLQVDDSLSVFKLLTYPDVLKAVRENAPLHPINIEINPINVCNQSCTWCTYGYLHDRKEHLEQSLILQVLNDAKRLGAESVTWTGGGEPTVYRPLVEVIEEAVRLGFRQGLNSNGSNLSERLIDLMVANFTYVRFSVDAGQDATYATTHRVPLDAFGKVMTNLRRLVAARDAARSRLTIGYAFLVDNSNVDDLLLAGHLAKQIGVDYFQVKPIVHYNRSNTQFAKHSSMWDRLEQQMPELVALDGDRFRVRLLGHKFRDLRLQDVNFGRTYHECRGNELLATVGADGSVDLCCPYKGVAEWSFGNVHDQSFYDIWTGSKRQELLKKIDVKKCPPLCKAHEINKILHFVKNFDSHREFV